MRLALSVYFFLASASVEAATTGDIWGDVNITQMVLQVAQSISPICNNTAANCTQLLTIEIPSCMYVLGSPGCWCSLANLDTVHYCAICMSSGSNDSTTGEQMSNALSGHLAYHKGCSAYEAFLNGTNTSNGTTSSSASGPKSISAGGIGGVVVGGLIGLVLIIAAGCLLYRSKHMQNKHERAARPMQRTSASAYTSPAIAYTPPAIAYTPPSNPYIQRQNAPYDTRMLNLLPQV